eukprot:m.72816 g.72816  ORF g.72816 m.72816 type:complete len:282 (+) comp8803_c0_seq1:1-846(+)
MASATARLRLATTVWNPTLPTTVFVHGLESSRDTWKETLTYCLAHALPAIAVDLRGHGESDLGDPDAFNIDALIDDVRHAAEATGPGRIVLVGHSMGGRVAMSYAAAYPDHVAALMIEDMDLTPRHGRDWTTKPPVRAFDRLFETTDAVSHALQTVGGYDADRIKGWQGSRIRSTPAGKVWSDINPESRDLAWQHVLATTDGMAAFTALGDRAAASQLNFPVHLLVAGKGAACQDPDTMVGMLPSLKLHSFPHSGHSIHRDAHAEFVKLLHTVVFESASRK